MGDGVTAVVSGGVVNAHLEGCLGGLMCRLPGSWFLVVVDVKPGLK